MLVACNKQKTNEQPIEQQPLSLYTAKNSHGMEIAVTNFGARIVNLLVPNKDGIFTDVVLGFDSLVSYTTEKTDFGATIGRYGNRIAKGKFSLDGKEYQLTINNGENSLHGGITGFQYQYFDIKQISANQLECTFLSPDGDNGYPGNLSLKVTYTVTENNELSIFYEATTDQPTVLNPTNHSYFNLSGDPSKTILDHVLYLDADKFTPTDSGLIPTGKIATVKSTPLDFRKPTRIGDRIDADYEPLNIAGGYDHNWIFNGQNNIGTPKGSLYCPASGIKMIVYTTEPAVQCYTGNFLDGSLKGKGGVSYQRRTGICLETQHYPDSPNHPNFPTTTLRPGETFTSGTVYQFSVE
jgi:aldose 1-epimerase